MRTTNPTLNEGIFSRAPAVDAAESMTVQGVVNKTAVLLCILAVAATWVWNKIIPPTGVLEYQSSVFAQEAMPFMIGGALAGFIVALVTIFNKQWAGVTAPLYALCQGLFLGGISALMELSYPGIVVPAIALTFGTLLALLLAYKSGMIRATENFKLGIVAATGGICLVYFATIVLGFFGIRVPFIHDGGPLGIAFSAFVVVIAALNLVLDFDFIEKGAARQAPKYFEWYAAFGLMVTLVWLYIEILRLLAKLRQRR